VPGKTAIFTTSFPGFLCGDFMGSSGSCVRRFAEVACPGFCSRGYACCGDRGAGFLGWHLCEALVASGHFTICLDNLSTGQLDNVRPFLGRPGFQLIESDVSAGIDIPGPVDVVAHFASAASPRDYLRFPLETLAAGSGGTENALRMAERNGARFLLACTSEVYGILACTRSRRATGECQSRGTEECL
jgi:nucleoside-diphosphate-sugar epimerase